VTTKREVAELACRILAVSMLALTAVQIIVVPVQIVMGLYSYMHGYGARIAGAQMIGSSVSAVLYFGLVCFLWTRSDWIAGKIMPSEGADSGWPRLRVLDLEVAAFSTVGILTLVYSAGYFCRSLGASLDSLQSDGLGFQSGPLYSGSRLSFAAFLAMESTLTSLAYAAIGVWHLWQPPNRAIRSPLSTANFS